jgi:type IV secretion system protein VirD4
VTKILHWVGSKVILDPSTELGPMLNDALERQQQEVVHIGIHGDGFNVLGWIDITDKEAEIHVKTVASWVYDEDKATTSHDDAFFTPMGRNLVTCLLADVLWSEDVEHSLAALAEGVAVPADQMLTLLRGIHATSRSRMARMLAGTLLEEAADETIGSIRLNAVNGVSWLFTEAYADLVSTGSFDPADLCNGRTTVFLNISLRTLETTPAIARVLVGALLNTLYRAEGQSGRVLFLMDEAARLGKLKALETARDTGAKYGVVLHLLYQSLGQLEEAWGRTGMRAWIDGAAWLAFASIRAGGAGRDISEWLGTHGVMAYSEGDNRGSQRPWGISLGSRSKGTTSNTHEISRKLVQAAELQQDLRADELVVIPAVGKPIRCGRAPYFRRRDLVRKVTANRFATSA